MAENWLGNAGKGGIGWSGAPNGLGRGGIRHKGWVYGLVMVNFSCLDFIAVTDGPLKGLKSMVFLHP